MKKFFPVGIVLAVIAITIIMISGHKFSKSGIDTPSNFNAFLDSCSDLERIQMLQALRQLPSFNKTEHIFNTVMDGNFSEVYVNYNDVKPEDVLKAVKAGKIDWDDISTSAIKKALVYRAYNKATYFFRNDNEIDYHDIVQWAARRVGVPKKKIETLSTYQLEKEVSKQFFSETWEGLTSEQREKITHDLNLKRSWNLNLTELTQIGEQVYELIQDAGTLFSLTKTMLISTLGYAFPENDIVCMFIMTVSMIKDK